MCVFADTHDILFYQLKNILLINVILYSRNFHFDADAAAATFSNNHGGALAFFYHG
jgi:hypothetical protein